MNVPLLAPKHARDGAKLLDVRAQITHALEAAGHRAVILEHEPDKPQATLRQKFLRLACECHQAVLVWPPGAAMRTTADEIVLLQEVAERRLIDVALILHEGEAEPRDQEWHVHKAADRSRYRDGILACGAFIIKWANEDDFDRPPGVYVDALL